MVCLLGLYSCADDSSASDAFGNFEAVETLVSAENAGKLIQFSVEEGAELHANQIMGCVDTTQLHLKKKQLIAQQNVIKTKFGGIIAQINVLKEQRASAEKDLDRLENMFAEKAATQKQMDDITGRISVLNKQMEQIETQNATVLNELKALEVQTEQIDDLISKSIIKSPIKGVVLNKYSEAAEITAPGKPLFKIANTDNMILRCYVSGAQLPQIKLGQQVTVITDKNKEENQQMSGSIIWISGQAEFTPKIIQTKDERVNMVYAVKVAVKNDGRIKIGMPGEVVF